MKTENEYIAVTYKGDPITIYPSKWAEYIQFHSFLQRPVTWEIIDNNQTVIFRVIYADSSTGAYKLVQNVRVITITQMINTPANETSIVCKSIARKMDMDLCDEIAKSWR